MTERNDKENVADLLKRLPPGYPVDYVYVNGATIEVWKFTNYSKGLAYFMGADCEVIVLHADRVDGIQFAPAETVEEDPDEDYE